jgi:5'(3')-deoxyribonucleotidase
MQNIDWSQVLKATKDIAIKAHKGQLDKTDKFAYIGHPRRVARNTASMPLADESIRNAAIAAAWLHDVIEDSDFTRQDLLDSGIPEDVVSAVVLLTKPEGLAKDQLGDYYEKLVANPIARAVKIADNTDNSNLQREKFMLESGKQSKTAKYRKYRKWLSLTPAEQEWFEDQILKQPDHIIYIDMDDVIVNFRSGIDAVKHKHPDKDPESHAANWDEVEGIFSEMKPLEGAIEAVKKLSETNEVYILSTAPWNNPSAWSDKLEWVHRHFGAEQFDKDGNVNWLYKRLIISHNKHLNNGAFLIDDRTANGAGNFAGIHVHFGLENSDHDNKVARPDWQSVIEYFRSRGLVD